MQRQVDGAIVVVKVSDGLENSGVPSVAPGVAFQISGKYIIHIRLTYAGRKNDSFNVGDGMLPGIDSHALVILKSLKNDLETVILKSESKCMD